LYVSPKALTMFRYAHENQIIGRNLLEFVAPEDTEKAKLGTQRMLQGNPIGTTEYKAIRADNSIFDVEVNGEFIRDIRGKAEKVVYIVRNISERKKSEKALKQSEEKLKAIIESQNEGIGLVDQNEEFIFVNPAANRIFESENLIGMSLFNFLKPSEIEKIKNQTQNRKKGDSNIYDLEILTQQGNIKYLSVIPNEYIKKSN